MADTTQRGFHSQPIDEVYTTLHSSEKGFSTHQAEQILHKTGLNEINIEHKVNPLTIFIHQFSSPLVWILIVALAISATLGEFIDATVIGIIIILNAILGFIQEYKAEKAIEALKRMASPKARVLRNGKEVRIESKYVVPGDILILEEGDRIPADARLIEIHSLHCEEASLTGESNPVTKILNPLPKQTELADRKNMVYASTTVAAGRGRAIVTGTGMHTEVGKIAKLIQEAHEQLTPLQRKLRELGKYLTIAVIIVAIVIFATGLALGNTFTVMLFTAIALAVAAIPEGLPAVITISLALGVRKMIKKNTLVRKLPSVETLGSVDVICTDKTGTLTHNQMTITDIWTNGKAFTVTGSGYDPDGKIMYNETEATKEQIEKILRCGLLCNNAQFDTKRKVLGDPTEAALLVSAEKAGLERASILKTEKRTEEIPFSSERKMMTTIHGTTSYSKGSPATILEKCNRIEINGKVHRLNRDMKTKLLKQNEAYAQKALRVLGFSYNTGFKKPEESEKNMVFLGFQAMIDPPREEVKESIRVCHKAGIKVVMITGDQLITAQAIAKELGIKGKAIMGKQLTKGNISNIQDIAIFARVNPEHKLRIVEALRAKGHVVAMTGDGVNDAPALKKADIGVSMGVTGTDVAKEASDMILTDDNFTSIVNAVEEGRGIFDNIRKFVNYLLSSNLGEIAAIFFASIFGLGLPLNPIQILWVNIVTDGLPATALSIDPHSKGIMNRPPRPTKESILSHELKWDIITFGILIGIGTTIIFWLYQGSGLMKAQTVAFTSLVLFELVRLQTIRSEYDVKLLSNKWLIIAVVVSILLHLLTIYVPSFTKAFGTAPLELFDWGMLVAASVVLLIVYLIIRYIRKLIQNKQLSPA